MPSDIAALIDRALAGDRRSLARLISRVENGGPDSWSALSIVYPRTGRAQIIGITGSPGTGKSTLVGEIAKLYRAEKLTVGIVAVDPTSPFSGGALLGDRIRMRDLAGDAGVFIRSMATRGSLGGLARATTDVVKVLDAAGYNVILIETVGAGQSEIDIARTADTVVVVEAPGLGDEVQAIKAGILEIADILVVNKADRDGAQSTVNALHAMIDLGTPHNRTLHHGALMELNSASGFHTGIAGRSQNSDRWYPPILMTIAAEGKGVDKVVEAIGQHHQYLIDQPEGQQRVRARVSIELETILRESLLNRLLAGLGSQAIDRAIDQVVKREIDPYTAVEQLQAAAQVRA
ncbi:MAG TPA: methylmalonyl Co-A mutase-associated GTPase MeaB [Anaerolineae bacterium]|nr:methylmalonyl Co-A mutase-associated GTPase MeaB [Anaerolineae bacterium]